MFGKLNDFGGEFEEVIVGGEFGAAPGVRHVVFEFGGGAPDFPGKGLVFEKIADGLVGAVLLELMGGVDGGGEVAGIHLGEDGLGGGAGVETLTARRVWREERDGYEEQQGAEGESDRHLRARALHLDIDATESVRR